MSKKVKENKRKKRWGDRSDGRRLRSLDPFYFFTPYIMSTRIGSANQIKITVDVANMEKYINKKRAEGLKGFGALHLILAAYVRTVSQLPALNRFISGQRIYARYDIQCMMAVKKDMSIDGEETVIKAHYMPDDTVETVFEKFNTIINETKQSKQNNVESTAKILMYLPRFLLRFTVGLLKFLDYFGILPKFLLEVSPFHGSFFITSMGSLGIPAIYHHLYDFGNCPAFCCYGPKYYKNEIDKNGETVRRKFMDMTFVLDERTCDGLYYAQALKKMLKYINDPDILDTEEITVIEDVD